MENRRIFLALALSLLVIFGWSAYFAPQPRAPLPGPPSPAASEAPGASGLSTPTVPSGSVIEPEHEEVVSADGPREIRIRTPLYSASLRSVGGVLRSFLLERYTAAPPRPGARSEQVDLVSPAAGDTTLQPLAITTGDRTADETLGAASFVVDGADADLTAGETARVVLRWADGRGSRITKTLEFSGSTYVVGVDIEARVAGGRPLYVVLAPGLATFMEPGNAAAFAERATIAQGTKVHRVPRTEFPIKSLTEKTSMWPLTDAAWLRTLEGTGLVRKYENVAWAGLDDNYFSALAFGETPFREVLVLPAPVAAEGTDARTGVLLALSSGGARFSLFAGPKDPEILRTARPDLASVVEFGFFESLSLVLLSALKFFYRYVQNYGLAIILLTVLVKVLFLPLTIKQLNTMQKLAKLRPQLKEIENRYGRPKGDAKERMEANRKMREEQMALYSREGVNPAGGCLPLLLQLPVLYGFYSLLGNSIELRHAPFVLWITDLSAKETLPIPSPIGVMPILMLLSMIVLQSLTPSTMDPVQQKIMYIMPVVFAWIFKDLASGLVLYWLTQNVLSIAQQLYMNRLSRLREQREKESRRLRK